MVTTLKSGLFVVSLCKKPAANLDELQQRNTNFKQLEEHRDYGNQIRAENGGDKKRKVKKVVDISLEKRISTGKVGTSLP